MSDCLDFLDLKSWPVIDQAWTTVVREYGQRGHPIPQQVGPVEALARSRRNLFGDPAPRGLRRLLSASKEFASGLRRKKRYGNNQRDCAVMNAAVQLLKEYGSPVTTVRASFMEGDEPYKGSWLLDRSHVQVAVVDPIAIPIVVKNIRIENVTKLKEEYYDARRGHDTTWMRRMKSA